MIYRFLLLALAIFYFSACKKQALVIKNDKVPETREHNMIKAAGNIPLSGWMGLLPDSIKITALSIPGTHNSGAIMEYIKGTAKCQDLTIGEQLNAGTRFLDIRCRQIKDVFAIHHGVVFQNRYFGDILKDIYSFLNNNPGEFIIMAVKDEEGGYNNKLEFNTVFDRYLNENPYRWYSGDSFPDLGQVRGKIVLLGGTRGKHSIGLNFKWTPNSYSSWGGYKMSWVVQDKYIVKNNNEKWNDIRSLLTQTKSGDLSRLFINFTSGYKSVLGIPNILVVADVINQMIENYFVKNTTGRYGVIPMDFANSKTNRLIVNTNF